METDEPIGADEAAAALASVRHSRARVAWSGYPAWYWLVVGACLAAGACAVLLPLGWALAASASLVVLVVMATRAACRARGVCEGWARSAITRRDRAVLYGPATAVIFTSGLTSRTAAWPSAVAAVLVFLLFAGTGLALSARAGFDHLIHAPARLRACAALDPVREIEFGALQALLGISKSALSKHVSALTDAGYVAQRRAVRDTRQRVWLCLTPAGRSAYRGHVAALHRIVGRAQAEPPNHEHPAEPDLTPATTS